MGCVDLLAAIAAPIAGAEVSGTVVTRSTQVHFFHDFLFTTAISKQNVSSAVHIYSIRVWGEEGRVRCFVTGHSCWDGYPEQLGTAGHRFSRCADLLDSGFELAFFYCFGRLNLPFPYWFWIWVCIFSTLCPLYCTVHILCLPNTIGYTYRAPYVPSANLTFLTLF